MGPFPARDVAASLTRKGFSARESHHTMYHFLYEGKDIGVFTKISHGEREIGIGLIKRMRANMRLNSNREFARFVECPMSQAEYEQILKNQGLIKDDETV
jgi:predicted RNA binding protein YcfA (HicA-like mRNA interferase family)